jgi:hypothetical protein
MQKLLARAQRAIFFDTAANVGYGERQNPMPGWVDIYGMESFVAFMRRHRHDRGRFRVVYHPGEDADAEFIWLCRLVVQIRNVIFAVDEIWNFCESGSMPKELKFLAVQGRHPGVTLIWTAQAPQLVASRLRTVASRYYVFRLTDPLDIEAMRGRIPSEAADQLPSLPDRSYIYRDECQQWKLLRSK